MAAPTIVAVGTAVGGAANVTPNIPSQMVNDIGVIWVECGAADTVTPPSGWAQITNSTVATGTPTKLTLLWRRLTGTDGNPTITDAGDHLAAQMIVIRGCPTSGNPWDVFFSSTELLTDTTVSITSTNTTVIDTLCMAGFSTGQDTSSTAGATGWANASFSSITERMDFWTAGGGGGGFAMATGVKPSIGATNATTATLSLTANFKAQIFIAFKPDTGSVATIPSLVTARWR